jgi:anti-sigma-K factor RskA
LLALVLRPAHLVIVPQAAPPTPAPLIALVTPKEGAAFAAVYDRTRSEVRLTRALDVPSGRDAELWAIGGDGVPRALGVLRGERRGLVIRPDQIGAGTTLAISIEPLGGSPKPTPTGPVVATGELVTA